ncbi:MAG: polysaccharide biosynthesis/export family protein [Limisphaerales bacterium]
MNQNTTSWRQGFQSSHRHRAVAWAAGAWLVLLAGICRLSASDTNLAGAPALSNAGTNTANANPGTNSEAIIQSSFRDMDGLDDKHKLVKGDTLSFRIVEDLEDTKSIIVADSGDLEVPYIGRFPAEGKTCRQLAYEIKVALEKRYYYHATVIIAVDEMALNRGRVYLAGDVHTPGPVDIPSDEVLTVSTAILRAGGLTDNADGHKVKVIRKGESYAGGRKTFVIDVKQIYDQGKVDLDLPLQPDDLIVVPERLVRF